MADMYIEFTDETLVLTEKGVEKLATLLHRPVNPALWAIKWEFDGKPNGISFHRSHKEAKQFAEVQLDSKPESHARLVDVSEWLLKYVKEYGYCWTNLNSFSEALTYRGLACNH